MSDIVYCSKRTKRRHLRAKVDAILHEARQKVQKLADNQCNASTSAAVASSITGTVVISQLPVPSSCDLSAVVPDILESLPRTQSLPPLEADTSDAHNNTSTGILIDSNVVSENESCSKEENEDNCTGTCQTGHAAYNIREHLASWAIKFNISHIAICALLVILKCNNIDVPLDARTLLATPKEAKIQTIAGGEYFHFGIDNTLHLALTLLKNSLQFSYDSIKSITMRINIDGMPLTNSTRSCLWPILAMVNEIPEIGVIMIGVFHGTSKPNNLHEYLQSFISDLKSVMKDGFVFDGRMIKVNIPDAFICDAPARSFLQCVKGHSGYYG